MSKVVFSICIPTYNRAKELKATLTNIVRQKGFDRSVEIVVADNASPDKTKDVVESFRKKYKNIIYSRSKTNIGSDRNMVRAAMLASGKYIKLMNDNKALVPGALERMKTIFAGAKESVVFFKNHGPYSVLKTSTVDDFLSDVSIHCTWLAGISFRRDLLHRVGITEKDYPAFMSQTGVMLKLLKARPSGLVVNGLYMTEPVMPFRGGYNFYEVYCEVYVRYLNQAEQQTGHE
jgi:glycosyltransferase involved in cell wall biosynthesis